MGSQPQPNVTAFPEHGEPKPKMPLGGGPMACAVAAIVGAGLSFYRSFGHLHFASASVLTEWRGAPWLAWLVWLNSAWVPFMEIIQRWPWNIPAIVLLAVLILRMRFRNRAWIVTYCLGALMGLTVVAVVRP